MSVERIFELDPGVREQLIARAEELAHLVPYVAIEGRLRELLATQEDGSIREDVRLFAIYVLLGADALRPVIERHT